ncbi:MAG: hypothetical protein EA419_11575 [Wenzhouxiangella sp.]|nr:MAG: hypothetical protein EA419_11575 [Wenzhouxiangella sp.]
MSLKFRLLLTLLSLALACAGLPAHACAEHEADEAAESQPVTADAHIGCPHHGNADPEPVRSDTPDEPAHDCCEFNCRCGCSAPAPVLISSQTPDMVRDAETSAPLLGTLAPLAASERLLRPPKNVS